MKYFLTFSSILATTLFTACGQKGPLVLPPKASTAALVKPDADTKSSVGTVVPHTASVTVQATQTKKN